ncbi:MAG TPA: thioredoxin family protein [Actinomycetota bacterium]|nr:thioredoxin family protein [Actinomycetota bacterium]
MNGAPPLIYVTAAGCHLCEEGRTVARRLAAERGLALEELDLDDPRARALAARAGPAFPPALYLGETLLGYGRLSERALRRRLRGLLP